MSSAGSNMVGGDLVSMPSNMTRLLECPICTEISTPPIFLCVKGHSVCNSCKRKITDCPLCKSPMTLGRNYALEDLINNSTFTCMYESSGCLDVIKGADMKNHLKDCPCRTPEVGQGDENRQEGEDSDSSQESENMSVLAETESDGESDEEMAEGNQEIVGEDSDFDTAESEVGSSSGEEDNTGLDSTIPETEEQNQKSESESEEESESGDEGDLSNSGMDTTESEEEEQCPIPKSDEESSSEDEEEKGPMNISNEESSSEDEEEQCTIPKSDEESSSEDEEEQGQNSGSDEISTEESSCNKSVLEFGSTEESEISDMSDISESSLSESD